MNTTLKTLLITSVLSTASIFGASAAPSGNDEPLESGSERSAKLTNQEISKKLPVPLDVMKIVESYAGKGVICDLNRSVYIPGQGDILMTITYSVIDVLKRSGSLSVKEEEDLVQKIDKMKIQESVHDVTYFVMNVFDEIYSTVLLSPPHREHLQNILSTFARYIETLNLPQFKYKSKSVETVYNKDDDLKTAGYTLSKYSLYSYAAAGSEEAQRYIALSSAYGVRLKSGRDDGDSFDDTSLESLKQRGWSCVQELLDAGYVEGKEGFDPERIVLEKFANRGWLAAQELLSEGYAKGENGIDPERFTEGYALGCGIAKNPEELIKCANMGWPHAQELVTEGYAKGAYGIAKNREKLLECAKKGWPTAQELLLEGYSYGWYGFSKDYSKLLEFANMGWSNVQDYLISGYAYGVNMLPQDQTLSRLFQIYFNLKNKGRI
jgi:hypothetical protein